ncbi:MAG: aminotransferase class V-fold PLP-dependent enzyme [Pirellulales bacterium]|nr:aminotransferase class V-fold PLP-dependent enzyme [Pirellulales bacterium]
MPNTPPTDMPAASSPHAAAWPLDPSVTMLNHGSFGACPTFVLERQGELRRQMESEPVRFLIRQIEPLLDESRGVLAELVGGDPANLVFVHNATTAVSGVLRSLSFTPGDELLVTNHDYNAVRNAVEFVAGASGARVVVAQIPLPVESPDQVVDAVLARVTDRTRLAVLDHITSPTALVLPIERLVRELDARGVDTLVDGAHGPGMVPLDLDRLGAAYYTGNCHKWLCAPKGAAFLHVRPDRQDGIHPTVLGHGLSYRRSGRSRLHDEFDWVGTIDPSPWICVGESIRFLAELAEGLDAMMNHNRRLAREARRVLCSLPGASPVCPESMLGSMAAVILPEDPEPVELTQPTVATRLHPMQKALFEQFSIEVPLFHWPAAPRRLVRVSAHLYNDLQQYEYLAESLRGLLIQ